MATFTPEETRRYRRHFVLEHVGAAGQARLQAATLVAEDELEALYLAAAGVGTLRVPTATIAQRVRAQNPLVTVTVDETIALPDRGALGAAHAALAKLRELLRDESTPTA